jgi:hypothetical protein
MAATSALNGWSSMKSALSGRGAPARHRASASEQRVTDKAVHAERGQLGRFGGICGCCCRWHHRRERDACGQRVLPASRSKGVRGKGRAVRRDRCSGTVLGAAGGGRRAKGARPGGWWRAALLQHATTQPARCPARPRKACQPPQPSPQSRHLACCPQRGMVSGAQAGNHPLPEVHDR